MTIKHIVISGGGPLGFRYLGALEKLEKENFWKVENIESIYATSIGSIIAVFIGLKYDWETLNKYVIERPWHDSIKVNAKQIFESYYNKGLLDKKITEIIFKPLLEAKDLNINLTLKEFYEYSKIDLHIFTFDLNKFETVELTHILNPDLSLLKALTMSSCIPGIFMPIIMNNACYLDGGVMCNYPINQCIRDNPDKNEILGITLAYSNEYGNYGNVTVNEDSSLLEYIMCMTINSMNFIRDSVKLDSVDNAIRCMIDENPLTLNIMQETLKSAEFRKNMLKMGEEDANKFLEKNRSLII
jgi:predicted acylesterase/phospholipase RssA